MNNYEYIIACLPDLRRDGIAIDVPAVMDSIVSQCSKADRKLVDFLLEGFNGDSLDEDFYKRALSHKNRFIREYFSYDLDVRNAKVDFLNSSLGRPAGQDTMFPARYEVNAFDDRDKVDAILSGNDILERERGLDGLMWDRIDDITRMDVFNFDIILAFMAKLQITGRWLKLDEQTGRELFRKLVADIRQTYDNKKNNI